MASASAFSTAFFVPPEAARPRDVDPELRVRLRVAEFVVRGRDVELERARERDDSPDRDERDGEEDGVRSPPSAVSA